MFSPKRLLFGGPFTILASTFLAASSPTAPAQKIQPKVLSDLRSKGKVTFFVVMKQQADTRAANRIQSWRDRGESVVNGLQEIAARTQQPILTRLSRAAAEATPFWIVNTIRVTTSDEGLMTELAARSDVDYLKADEAWTIPEPLAGVGTAKVQNVEWGVARVRAPEVWERFGVRGEGVVVASIDTGVQFDHPALVGQYRGRQAGGTFDHNYNWYDPSHVCPPRTPCDNVGHGTHTMGTMVGDDGGENRIGVAPGAQWIAAKGCESNQCSLTALLASGQWILAPTDLNDQNPRPDLRPHVVNNSWGDGPSDPFYRMTVRAWVDAGIFPAFANGNAGPNCGSVGAPGAYPESFGVGATDIADNIAYFSSRGPATAFGGATKPNVSGPGVNVRSSVPLNTYAIFTGTSMATPHIVGVVALVWSASPALAGDISGTFDLLQTKAHPRTDFTCGPEGPPNNAYGWGIVDALSAVEEVISRGTLTGRVTDASSGAPLGGALVRAVGPLDRTTHVDSEGNYKLMLEAGVYDVSSETFGHTGRTQPGVVILEGLTTTQDFALEPFPMHQISGRVTSSIGAAPLAGVEVRILGTPLPSVNTDADGFYLFPSVPEGTYDLQALLGRCFKSTTQQRTVATDLVLDFVLDRKVDDFGYTCDDQIAFHWIAGVERLPLTGDDEALAVDLPFPFTFYGRTYGTIFLSTNGFANFLGLRRDYLNTCFPIPTLPNAVIAPLWDDLVIGIGSGSGVFSRTEGTAPNRQFIVEWRDASFRVRPLANVATFELILDEAADSVTLQYNRADGDGNGLRATVGVEDENGLVGLPYSCYEPSLSVGKAIKYFPLPGPVGIPQGNSGSAETFLQSLYSFR